MRSRSIRRLLLAVIVVFAAVAGRAAADEPNTVYYVNVDVLPILEGGALSSVRLHRGDVVTYDPAKEPLGSFVAVQIERDGKTIAARVPFWTLTKTKPAAANDAETKPAATVKLGVQQEETRRLTGTWVVVGMSVLEKTNPEPTEMISLKGAPNPFPIPAGFPVTPQVAAAAQSEVMAMMILPRYHFVNFSGKEAIGWSVNVVNTADGKSTQEPGTVMKHRLEINAATAPRKLDLLQAVPSNLKAGTPGIYEWDGEVLKWQWPATLVGAMTIDTPRGNFERIRPTGFAPEQAKQGVVLYLTKVDAKRFPPPPAPPPNPAQVQGGNAF